MKSWTESTTPIHPIQGSVLAPSIFGAGVTKEISLPRYFSVDVSLIKFLLFPGFVEDVDGQYDESRYPYSRRDDEKSSLAEIEVEVGGQHRGCRDNDGRKDQATHSAERTPDFSEDFLHEFRRDLFVRPSARAQRARKTNIVVVIPDTVAEIVITLALVTLCSEVTAVAQTKVIRPNSVAIAQKKTAIMMLSSECFVFMASSLSSCRWT